MLKLSKTVEYALISLNHINQFDNSKPISVRQISDRYNIPYELLAKILQKLSKEYEIAINNFNLNENEIRTIIINGFKSAFLQHNKRRKLIRQVVDELESEFNFSRHLII